MNGKVAFTFGFVLLATLIASLDAGQQIGPVILDFVSLTVADGGVLQGTLRVAKEIKVGDKTRIVALGLGEGGPAEGGPVTFQECFNGAPGLFTPICKELEKQNGGLPLKTGEYDMNGVKIGVDGMEITLTPEDGEVEVATVEMS